MRKHHVITWIGTTVGTLALAASAASAASTATVTVGGAQSGSFPISLTNVGNVTTRAGTGQIVCTQNEASATSGSTVNAGVGVSSIGLLRNFTFAHCTAPGGGINLTMSSAASRMAIDAGATAASTDTISIHIDNFVVAFSNAACEYTASGAVRGTFTEADQRLQISEPGTAATPWKVTQVSTSRPCLGKIKVGDPATFSGRYQLTSSKGSIFVS